MLITRRTRKTAKKKMRKTANKTSFGIILFTGIFCKRNVLTLAAFNVRINSEKLKCRSGSVLEPSFPAQGVGYDQSLE